MSRVTPGSLKGPRGEGVLAAPSKRGSRWHGALTESDRNGFWITDMQAKFYL